MLAMDDNAMDHPFPIHKIANTQAPLKEKTGCWINMERTS